MSAHRTSPASTPIKKAAKPDAPAKAATRPVRRRQAKANPSPITPRERYQLIAEAAYFIAERRGFAPGYELEDWIQAELEVARRLGKKAAE